MKFPIESVYTWYRNLLRNPKYRWWAILGTIAYLLSPIDIAPDFIPIVGQLDDIFLLSLLVGEVSQLVIEGFKERQGGQKSPSPDSTKAGTTGSTVDVDAIPVK